MTEKTLNEVWGDKQISLSYNQAKRIINSFKKHKLKGYRCLIFSDNTFTEYREVGEQYKSHVVDFKGVKK